MEGGCPSCRVGEHSLSSLHPIQDSPKQAYICLSCMVRHFCSQKWLVKARQGPRARPCSAHREGTTQASLTPPSCRSSGAVNCPGHLPQWPHREVTSGDLGKCCWGTDRKASQSRESGGGPQSGVGAEPIPRLPPFSLLLSPWQCVPQPVPLPREQGQPPDPGRPPRRAPLSSYWSSYSLSLPPWAGSCFRADTGVGTASHSSQPSRLRG